MNREILFKAKRIDNGEWVEGYFFDDGMIEKNHYFVGGLVIEPYRGSACDDWDITGIDFYEVGPDTICQYTGLTDENGQKIWENDIVSFLDTKSTENGYSEVDCVGKVSWDVETCSFQVSNRTMAESYEVLDGGCKVLGNVFDNPELDI